MKNEKILIGSVDHCRTFQDYDDCRRPRRGPPRRFRVRFTHLPSCPAVLRRSPEAGDPHT